MPPRAILPRAIFDPDTGRLSIRALARHHVATHYRAKSVRCQDCALDAACEGAHINLIRDQGLSQLRPFAEAPYDEATLSRLANGRPPEPVAPSLPGFPEPQPAPADPLAVAGRRRDERRKLKRSLPLIPNRS